MTNSISIKHFAYIVAIFLGIFGVLAISVNTANAQYYDYDYGYDYGYQNTVPLFSGPTSGYNPYHNQPPYYPPPVYTPPPVSVTCYASPQSIYVGASTIWTAYATGGTGSYSYSWSGDENLSGSNRTVSKAYYYPGQKRASVTVYSGGQTITRVCGNTVSVNPIYQAPAPTPVYQYPVQPGYPYGQSNIGLDIGCYADPSNIKINQPTTWLAEVTGGYAPYTYTWTGTDGLTGSQSSVVKYYATAGSKSAIVTVTSADGRSSSRACSNQVNVARAATAYSAPARPATQPAAVVAAPTPTPSPIVVAAVQSPVPGAFSLQYVPWGWVALLVILVLFATVLYLLFNREKI